MDLEEMDKIMGVNDKWLMQRKTKLSFLYRNYTNPVIKNHIKTLLDFISSDTPMTTEQYQAARDFLESKDIPL